MSLSPEEKHLIERKFVAEQERVAKRRARARAALVIGLVAGIGVAALREFRVHTWALSFLGITYLACLLAYVGAGVFPTSLRKDLDPRWHLNPWREILLHLSEGRTQAEAIALLATPYLARGLFSLIYFSLK